MYINSRSTLGVVVRVYGHLTLKRKYQLALLAIFMVVTSLIEAVSIGLALPFLAALATPEDLGKIKFLQLLLNQFEINDLFDIRLLFTLLFVSLIFLSGLLRILFFIFQTNLSMLIGVDFSAQAYERTLRQPYEVLISRNSGEILAGVQKAKDLVGYIVQPTLSFISSIFMLTIVIITVFLIEPKVAIFGLIGFGSLYLLARALSGRRLQLNSQIYADELGRVNQIIQEGIGGIRDVIVDATQSVYATLYRVAVTKMQSAGAGNTILGQMPRFLIEMFSMAFLAGMVLVMLQRDGNFLVMIPLLGVVVLASQRLLPVLQQAYAAYASIKGGLKSTIDALALLDQSEFYIPGAPMQEALNFSKVIRIKEVSFGYKAGDRLILNGINLEIKSGSRIGFIGPSGGGKSTLIDLVMGLLVPTSGAILVDGHELTKENMRCWHSHISHVPQSIFLADTSIAGNIAFGVDQTQIDWVRVRAAAEIAQLSEVIESLPKGYLTIVGERGVRLSGGQRQRIGLARAVYKRSKLLILDEATSALDGVVEKAVIDAINSLEGGVTMLQISHRLSSLQYCDYIVEIKNGKVHWVGSYSEIGSRPVQP